MEPAAYGHPTILRAQPEHVDLVAPLFDAYRQFYKQASDLEQARLFLRARLENQEAVIFLAFDGAAAVGFTQLYPTFSSISMRPLWILNDLYVRPEMRRSGIARLLLERARQLAEETGAEGLMLETAKDNPAQYLYEKMGWERDEVFYRYYYHV